MLDLRQYTCLGAALRDALDRFSSEICLIEADRDREKVRLTYSDFKELALPLARALEDADYDAGDRAAIIMTNQSKWLISAYAIFYCGGVLVPLDYKLTAAEHLQLLAHSKAKMLVVEYHLWRAIMESPDFQKIGTKIVLVTEAPLGVELAGAFRWEDFKRKGAPDFVDAAEGRRRLHRVFLGNGRASQGLCAHPRKLSGTMPRADRVVSLLAGGAVFEHSSDQSRD